MSATHNRINTDAYGYGGQLLRHASFQFNHDQNAARTPVRMWTFPVDVDIVEVAIMSGLVPAANGSNVIKVLNGLVAANKPIVSFDLAGTPLVVQVPVKIEIQGPSVTAAPAGATVTAANCRLPAGTPLCVSVLFGGDDSAAGAEVDVQVYYEVPATDANAVKVTY